MTNFVAFQINEIIPTVFVKVHVSTNTVLYKIGFIWSLVTQCLAFDWLMAFTPTISLYIKSITRFPLTIL